VSGGIGGGGASAWSQWVDGELAAIRAQGRWREVRALDAAGPTGTLAGRPVISFAANDYLGLSVDPEVVAAAHGAIDRWGTGSGASRLIVGSRPVHHDLEAELAAWKRTDGALVFPSGFAANLGVLCALGGPDVTIVSDELNHASIIDGARLSRSSVTVYRHNDVGHVASILDDVPGRALVVSDSVFSMDGDVADVDALARVCAGAGALLVLDEAHAVLGPGVPTGPDGTTPADIVRVGTLSKTLGALGGFVAASRPVIDLLVNRARSHIFTTALSPADTAAALAAVRICRGPRGEELTARLRTVVERVAPGHPSPIVPILLGAEEAAIAASAALLERGILVPAIRPPTVAPGTCRLRIALSAAHTDAMVDVLLGALDDLAIVTAGKR
jgi:8-amino-7-oxononanoate synthase